MLSFEHSDDFGLRGSLAREKALLENTLAMLKLGRLVALGLVALGTTCFLVLASRDSRRETAEAGPYTWELAVLAGEPRQVRSIEPRVTGGFPYVPFDPEEAGSVRDSGKAWNRFFRASAEDSSPQGIAATAIAHLIGGDPDKAQALLKEARARGGEDPRILSDLSAAYLVRAEKTNTPYDLIQALAAADRALEIAPSLAEAQFNKALALTRLGLTSAAEKAWDTYRDLDAGSGWGQEADAHLQRLAQPKEIELWKIDRDRLDAAALAGRSEEVRRIVEAYRQPARLYVEDQLLADWAAARAAGKAEESERPLVIARAVADALGAGMLREEVAVLEEAVREGGTRLRDLVHGHHLYARARELHEKQDYPAAEPLFHQAFAALDSGRTPFAAWPRLYVAIITHHHADQPGAIRQLEQLRRRYQTTEYSPLLGMIDWMIGQARGVQGPIASALPASESALRHFQQAGEVENQAAMDSTLARIYTELGDVQRAWRHHQAALLVLPRLYKPRRAQNILSVAIQTLRKTGDLAPAVYFQEMLIDDAYQANNPIGITVALRNQASLLHELGRRDEAIASLGQARTAAGRIGDTLLRQSVEVEVMVAEGRILRKDRPLEALRALDAALAVSLQDGNRHLLIQILQERAETWLTLGREREAETDLEAGLAELERQRRVLGDGKLRIFFADQGRALLEERITLQMRRGESAEASLDTAERLRARALLDVIGGSDSTGWPEPIPVRNIAAELPAGTAIVAYLWVRDDLLAWVLDRNGVELVPLGSGRERVEGLMDRLLRTLKKGGEIGTDARRLRRRLIAPLEHRLAGASTLIVIPDGKLCRLPFSALQDEQGRFLLEEYRLAAAPSASVYLSLAERYQERSVTAPASILLVGEPEFDRSLFPTLSRLPASAQEIESLSRLYDRSLVLRGEKATAERLLNALSGEDVLHFTGHTVTPPGAEAPSLLLTRSAATGESGLLPAEAIQCPRLPRLRLAVLAGCNTAEGRLSQNEGTLGLARSFLQAGIPVVVASLWEADDEPALRIFSRFHELLRGGADPLTALRRSQLDLLYDPDRSLSSPRTWAAFQAIGGAFAPAGDLPPPSSVASLPGR
jgi:CHAT domain-containing protein